MMPPVLRSLLTKGLLGFVAGFCVATLLFSLYGLPAPELARAFLRWPFISLIIASLLLLVFADSLRGLLGRGEIKIKWGDTEITLNEIADSIDKEISSQLDRPEDPPEQRPARVAKKNIAAGSPPIIDEIQARLKIADPNLARIVHQLKHTKYKWRNVETLSKIMDMERNRITNYAKAHPEMIKHSTGRDGTDLVRLTDSASLAYDAKIRG